VILHFGDCSTKISLRDKLSKVDVWSLCNKLRAQYNEKIEGAERLMLDYPAFPVDATTFGEL
jgi:predicted nucleotidyltransferase